MLLNVIFNIIGRKTAGEGPVFAEGPAITAISDEDEMRLDPDGPMARRQQRAQQRKQR